MTGADTNPAPKAMDPDKLRALCATGKGRSMVASHAETLRAARTEYADANQPVIEAMRERLAKAEAEMAGHLAVVDGHIAACEAALAAAGELRA